MIYRSIGPVTEKVSLLGFGAMRFPTTDDGKIDREESIKMLDLAYQNGVNYFDTAYMYHDGESQSFLGEAMKKYPRDSFFITNKMPVWMADTKEDVARIFEDQLAKCQVEHFDFYLLHAVSDRWLKRAEEFGVIEYLQQEKKAGRIKKLGFSFHDVPSVLETVCQKYQWDFSQLQLNYLDWEFQQAKDQYEILEKHNIPCIVMEPVRGGVLANLPTDAAAVLNACNPNVSQASFAMRYCASLPNVFTVLSGMTTMEQVADNLKTFDDFKPLTDDEKVAIDKALAIYKQTNLVPCTDCKYCIDCPVSINIPEVFKLYNVYRIGQSDTDFANNIKSAGHTPADCIDCGACSAKCPQHIDIPTHLKEIDSLVTAVTK